MFKKIAILCCTVVLSTLPNKLMANDNFSHEEQEFINTFGEEQIPDPYEKFNRGVFAFNMAFDKVFIIPVTTVYSTIIPRWGRDRVSNFMNNLQEPVSMVSALLQLDKDKFANSCGRFLINSTIGIGGLIDIASIRGIKPQYQGMEQVLAKYGGRRGDYIVLPLLGGASSRHTTGIVLDALGNPINYIVNKEVLLPLAAGNYISKKDSYLNVINNVYNEAADPYTRMRSLYWQNRYPNKEEN